MSMTGYTAVVQDRPLIHRQWQISCITTSSCIRMSPLPLCRVPKLTHALPGREMYGPPPVSSAAAVFQKLCYENKDALSAGIIVAGWDKEVGPSIYNIPLGGGLFRQPWAIGGMTTFLYARQTFTLE